MISIVLSIPLIGFSDVISFYIFDSKAYSHLVIITCLIAIFQTGSEIPQLYLRRNQKFLQFGLMSVLQTITYPALGLYMLFVQQAGLDSIFYALMVSYGLKFFLGILFSLEAFSFSFDLSNAHKYIKYAILYLPHSLIGWGNNQLNRYITLFLFGAVMLGQFNAMLKMCSFFIFFTIIFKSAWVPIVMDLIQKSLSYQYYQNIFNKYLRIFSSLAIVFNFFIPLLASWLLPEAYHVGFNIIPWLIGAIIYQFFSDIVNIGSIIQEKPIINVQATLINLFLFLTISLSFAQLLGIHAIVLGMFMGQFLSRLYLHWKTIRYFGKEQNESKLFFIHFFLYTLYAIGLELLLKINQDITYYISHLGYAIIFLGLFLKLFPNKNLADPHTEKTL